MIFDYFIDFETINNELYCNSNDMDIDDCYYYCDSNQSIFMIGIGFTYNKNILSTQTIINSLIFDKSLIAIKLKQNNNWEYICIYS